MKKHDEKGKIRTGLDELDEILYGGFDRGCNILFIYNTLEYTKGQSIVFQILKNAIEEYDAHAIIMSLSMPIVNFIKYAKTAGLDIEKYKEENKISLLELYESLHRIYSISKVRKFDWTHVIDNLDTETYIPKLDSVIKDLAERNHENNYVSMMYDISGLSALYDDDTIIRTLRKYHIVFSHISDKMLFNIDVVNRAIIGKKLLAWLIQMHDEVIEVYRDNDGTEYLEIKKSSDPNLYYSIEPIRVPVNKLFRDLGYSK